MFYGAHLPTVSIPQAILDEQLPHVLASAPTTFYRAQVLFALFSLP